MRHDWIFDVLSDLHSYATRNDLPGLARKVEEAMAEARREVSETEATGLALVAPARHRAH
jgi:hypothetical protein